jgi:hypothetical protein
VVATGHVDLPEPSVADACREPVKRHDARASKRTSAPITLAHVVDGGKRGALTSSPISLMPVWRAPLRDPLTFARDTPPIRRAHHVDRLPGQIAAQVANAPLSHARSPTDDAPAPTG